MKNLFNKKIYIITGIFIIVFVGLFFGVNKVNAGDYQYYYEINKVVGATGNSNRERRDFRDKNSCESSFEKISLNLNPISHCDPSKNYNDVVYLNPDTIEYYKGNSNDESSLNSDPLNYKLLAPIGKTKEITTNDIGKYFNIMFNIAIALAGGLAVVMLVLGGIQWMGSESVFGKTEGKERITSAILGLLIAIGSYTLLNTINPDLLGKKGLNIGQVSIKLEQPILSDTSTPIPTGNANSFPPECTQGVEKVNTEGGLFIACKGDVLNKLKNMIYKAKQAKINLSGGGFRTRAQQIQARRDNGCADILNTPPSQCTKAPTAKPGTSMHEKGVAFDFTCDGNLISVTENEKGEKKSGIFKVKPETKKCFDWLKTNAGDYGLKNLPSENWHWSTTGK